MASEFFIIFSAHDFGGEERGCRKVRPGIDLSCASANVTRKVTISDQIFNLLKGRNLRRSTVAVGKESGIADG